MTFLRGLPTLEDVRGDIRPLSQRHSSASQHGASRWLYPPPALGFTQHPVQGVPQTMSPKRENNAAAAIPSSIRT